jgi:hypothetical protein
MVWQARVPTQPAEVAAMHDGAEHREKEMGEELKHPGTPERTQHWGSALVHWEGFVPMLLLTVVLHALLLFGPRYRGVDAPGGVLAILSAVYGGGSALLVSVIFFLLSLLSGNKLTRRESIRWLFIGACLASVILTIPAGQYLLDRDVQRAKQFCERLVEEGAIAQGPDGLYPKRQEDFLGNRGLPRLLRGRCFYFPTRDRKGFFFCLHSGFDFRWYGSGHPVEWSRRYHG